MRQVTDKENMAMALMMFVMIPCTAAKVSKIPMARIFDGVPADELPRLRAGIDALLQYQLLGREGNDVGISMGGKVFLAYIEAVRSRSPTLEVDIKDHPVLDPIRGAIARDPRFNAPVPLTHTPKAAPAAKMDGPGIWNFWTILLVIVVVLGVFQLLKAVFR